MNPPRCDAEDYINFLVSTPLAPTSAEAGRVQPARERKPAHDAFTRLLNRLEPSAEALWVEVAPQVRRTEGVLVIDDSVLDKPHARHMGLVGWHYSGKHRKVVRGIDLVSLLWTDGDALWPCDYRLVDPGPPKAVAQLTKATAKGPARPPTKNDHFRDMLEVAKGRGFGPRYVLFDTWYSGKDNLKEVRKHGWHFLTQVRCNRRVNHDHQGNRGISELPISEEGTVVHLEGFGLIKAFRIVTTNGDTEHWITSDLHMDTLTRRELAELAWGIEEYHRGLKQHCGLERCQARQARAQRNHIGCAIRAFVRLEFARFHHGLSWFAAKLGIIRDAVRGYLANPRFRLDHQPTA